MIFQNDNPKICALCEKAMPTREEGHMFCSKKGLVTSDYRCGRYRYDPLKRNPKLKPRLPEYDEEDFVL